MVNKMKDKILALRIDNELYNELKKHADNMEEMIPYSLFQTLYTTPPENFTQFSGEWIKTYEDDSGYSHRIKTYAEIHNEKKPPDPD